MKRASLKSRHRYLVIIIALIFLIAAIIAQTTISGLLHELKPKISAALSATLGYRIELENISFGILKGLHISGISIFYSPQDKSPDLFIKDAFVRVNPLNALMGRITADKIRINETVLLMKKKPDGYNLQIIYSDICKKIVKDSASVSLNIFIETAKLAYPEGPSFKENMLILVKHARIQQSGDKFRLTSGVEFYYKLPEEVYISRFLKNNKIRQNMKLAVQGNIAGKNLNMELVTVSIGKEQVLGMGVTRNFMERNPDIDLIIIPSSLSLANIDFMKNNFDSEGDMFISLKFNGPMDSVKTDIYALLENCSFTYVVPNGEIFNIQQLRGELDYRLNRVKLARGHLKFNDMPLDIEIQTGIFDKPDIYFSASIPKEFFVSKNLPLDKFSALFKGSMDKTLRGNLEINTLYLRKGLKLDMRADLKNIDFDYYGIKEKYFNSETVEFIENSAIDTHKLSFSNLRSKIYVSRNNIAIKDISFSGYDNKITGEINLDTANKPLLTVSLIGVDLGIKPLMRDLRLSDKLLSGKMNAKIVFNNNAEDFLEGRCYISDGMADLDAFAQAIRLPSLKETSFDIMHGYFSISKNNIKVRGIKLYSPDIMLDAYWDTNGKIDGTANLRVSSELLNQSAPFRKLLRIARSKTPYVDFKFLLGGSPKASRFMWMKNEFKEKIQGNLPAWARRKIEASLNKAIDELSVK